METFLNFCTQKFKNKTSNDNDHLKSLFAFTSFGFPLHIFMGSFSSWKWRFSSMFILSIPKHHLNFPSPLHTKKPFVFVCLEFLCSKPKVHYSSHPTTFSHNNPDARVSRSTCCVLFSKAWHTNKNSEWRTWLWGSLLCFWSTICHHWLEKHAIGYCQCWR